MDSRNHESKSCLACNGSGKVISGYGVICTEIVEKVEMCPECKGKGFLELSGSLEEQARHYSKF